MRHVTQLTNGIIPLIASKEFYIWPLNIPILIGKFQPSKSAKTHQNSEPIIVLKWQNCSSTTPKINFT